MELALTGMADSGIPSQASTVQTPKRTTMGPIFSVLGAALILAQGLLIFLYGAATTFWGFETELRAMVLSGLGLGLVGIFGVAIGLIILAGAYLIYTPGLEIVGGTTVLIFSVLSILIGGGWLLGLGFGIFGGILGLLKK